MEERLKNLSSKPLANEQVGFGLCMKKAGYPYLGSLFLGKIKTKFAKGLKI